jgi:hypothetical protein
MIRLLLILFYDTPTLIVGVSLNRNPARAKEMLPNFALAISGSCYNAKPDRRFHNWSSNIKEETKLGVRGAKPFRTPWTQHIEVLFNIEPPELWCSGF